MKVVIFGNSGSGKTSLAKELSAMHDLSCLDLDSIAWEDTQPPSRRSLTESKCDIDAFINANNTWVIEGCYSDLLEIALPASSDIIFLNLPVSACISNARSRPWEPHKYQSKEAQDNNLGMLIDWIAQYPVRSDTFSKASHEALYNSYTGRKVMHTANVG